MAHDEGARTMTVVQAARILGLSRGLTYEAIRRGELPALRVGRRLLVPRAALMRLLDPTGAQESDNGSSQGG